MFAGIFNRFQWLVVMSALLALLCFVLLISALAGGKPHTPILLTVLTGLSVLLHYLATERARAYDRGRMLTLMRVLNRPGDLRDLIGQVTAFMKEWTGCEAVGVRLSDGDAFPYYETRGSSNDLILAEDHFCVRAPEGNVLCDVAGNPALECMCGNVLRGNIDLSAPGFTSKGSYFSNHATCVLAASNLKDRQTRTSSSGEDSESVALIPLRVGSRTLGLLLFNDRAKGASSRANLRFLEEVADIIALSLGQRNAQELLAKSEFQYRQIVETADEGMLSLDAHGRISYLNARSAAILFTPAESAKGRELEDFLFPEDVAAHRQRMRERRAGRSDRYQTRFRRSDGTGVWCLVSPRPNFSEQREFLGSFAMVSDITDRKDAEVERERLQAQLLQAQKLESIGRLAGGVAHDFNNMLSVINGHAEMALDHVPVDDPLYEDLWNILNAGRRSATLTRQLLAFARQQTIQPRVVDLNRIVSSMLKLLGRLIGEDIELSWLPGAALWRVRVDPAQIDQVLANLAVNARDAIAGVGKVSLATSNHELTSAECSSIVGSTPGQYVRLSISDSGCGMDGMTIEHIFEPFFTTKKMGEGTGLGLATVYGVVRQNHGFISVYSEPGTGTSFNIYLPRCESSLTSTAESESIVEPIQGSETVLIVEDEEAVLSLVRGRLEESGYRVMAASSPEVAVRLAAECQGCIDLLLTDMVMPGMNGLELSQALLRERPQLKCLFMSGYPTEAAAHHGIIEAGLHFIQKPFSLRALAKRVREVIDETVAQG